VQLVNGDDVMMIKEKELIMMTMSAGVQGGLLSPEYVNSESDACVSVLLSQSHH